MKQACVKLFLVLFTFIALASCSSKLQNELNAAEELTIHFYNNAHADSVIKILHTNSKDAIKTLSGFIDSRAVHMNQCGHDGDIIFKRGDQVIQVVDFNLLQMQCRHFQFEANGKLFQSQMNQEAADFLLALWSGKRNF